MSPIDLKTYFYYFNQKCSQIGQKFCQFVCNALLLNLKKKIVPFRKFRTEKQSCEFSCRKQSCRELSGKNHVANCPNSAPTEAYVWQRML